MVNCGTVEVATSGGDGCLYDFNCPDGEVCENGSCVSDGSGGGGGGGGGGIDPSLISVDSCTVQENSVLPDEVATITATISNQNSNAADVTVTYTAGGETVSVATYTIQGGETISDDEQFIPQSFGLSGTIDVTATATSTQVASASPRAKTVGAAGVVATAAYLATR